MLVVDDDTSVLGMVERTLSDYRVSTAHDASEALAILSTQNRVDLLITDYLMPAITGDKLATRLRETHPAMKTLLMTGHGPFVDVNACGIDDHLARNLVS